MRYLSFSLLFILSACASDYSRLKPQVNNPECIRLRPVGKLAGWYDASVDVVGKHLSGLVLVKNTDEETTRTVFTNEAGVTFFDFQFGPGNTFAVKSIISSLDRKPVINTLRRDFELMLGIPFREGASFETWTTEEELFTGVRQKKDRVYFITDKECASLRRIESGSKRKRLVTVTFSGSDASLPESVEVKHFTFNMIIQLKKIERE